METRKHLTASQPQSGGTGDDLAAVRVEPDYRSIIEERKHDFYLHVSSNGEEVVFDELPVGLKVMRIWRIDGCEFTRLEQAKTTQRNLRAYRLEDPHFADREVWFWPTPRGTGWISFNDRDLWFRKIRGVTP
jgi:hypothetical protein